MTQIVATGNRQLGLLGPRVCSVIHIHHMLHGELRVSLRGGKPLVAQHLLDRAQVGALLQQMCSEGMTQRVRMYVWRESPGDRDFFDNPSHAPGSEASSAAVHQ